jgi:glycerol-3-phosphate acyltransferase PlsY
VTAEAQAALALLLAYAAGSLPASWLAGRALAGTDLRSHGSGNLGATNVYRLLGIGPAAAVVLVDVGKGWAATALLPRLLADGARWADAFAFAGALTLGCGAAAIVGHVHPVWLRFRGGKGVATGAGVFLALAPLATAAAVLLWAAGVALLRIVSVASLSLGVLLPFLVWLEERGSPAGAAKTAFAAAAGVFLFWTHRENLRRLARGEERRITRAGSGTA